MKYIIIFICAISSNVLCQNNQDTKKSTNLISLGNNGQYSYQEVIQTGLASEENYKRIKSYIATTYRSANAVLQLDSKEIIIAKGNYEIVHNFVTHRIWHTLSIEIKDQKIRVTYDAFRVSVKEQDNNFENKGHWLSFPNKEAIIKKASIELAVMILDLKNQMKQIKTDW